MTSNVIPIVVDIAEVMQSNLCANNYIQYIQDFIHTKKITLGRWSIINHHGTMLHSV